MGLNERARNLVDGMFRKPYRQMEMCWEPPMPLLVYYDFEHHYEEREQECPWSSGPCHFFALWDRERDEWVPESLWTEAEIEEYL
jgi:hypothetical protein